MTSTNSVATPVAKFTSCVDARRRHHPFESVAALALLLISSADHGRALSISEFNRLFPHRYRPSMHVRVGFLPAHSPAHRVARLVSPLRLRLSGGQTRCRENGRQDKWSGEAAMRPPPPPVAAAPPRGLHLLTSVAPAVAIAAALVCGAGPVAVVPDARANPFARAPPMQGKPFANTPYAESQKLLLGLDKLGKIRPCPSTNPGCVSTNPLGSSSSFASPLLIPESSAGEKAVVSLRQAIERTQKNVSFKVDQDTPYGHYMEVEMDGGVGRDVMEFLVKKDAGVVAYRCLATKVTFVYPFTTAVGDSKGQKKRIAAILQELGWYAPDIQSSMDPGVDYPS